MKITAKKAKNLVENGALLLDIRSGLEYMFGHIEGSVNLSIPKIPKKIDELAGDKNRAIIVYCASGSRTPMAIKMLNNAGYKNVYDLGAISNWKE